MKKIIAILMFCFLYFNSNPVFAELGNGFIIKFKTEQGIKANEPTPFIVQQDAKSNSVVAVYVECWTKDYTNDQAHLLFPLKRRSNGEYRSLIKFPTAHNYFVKVHFEGNPQGTIQFKVKVQ